MAIIDCTDVRQPEQYISTMLGPTGLIGADEIVKKAKSLYEKYVNEKERLEGIDKWLKGNQDPPTVHDASTEVKELLELSRTPWLGLVVTTLAQAMFVDGFRSPDTGDTVAEPWKTWVANGMNSRQVAIHRAALGYGYAWMLVEEGKAQDGSLRSVMRGLSPKRVFAEYDDSSFDDWPRYAIRVDGAEDHSAVVWLYDDTFSHKLQYKPHTDMPWVLIASTPHKAGAVPLVRYTNQLDLDGKSPGEVEPFIGVAARIDKSSFDRLLTQHYNSWKKLWIAGLTDAPTSDDEARRAKLKLRQEDILIAESTETKFGAIPETGLEGFIASIESDIEHLAAISQLPNHLLTGKMVNLSAEALSAARAPLTQKVYERQVSFGASHAQALRLAAKLQGDDLGAGDVMAHVTWQDMEVRSLAQAADALGKLATQLGVPRVALWRMIPRVSQLDVEEWQENLLDDDPAAAYLRQFNKLDTGKTPAGVTPPDKAAAGVNAPDAGADG